MKIMKSRYLIFIVLLVLSLAVSGCSDKESITVQDEDGQDIDITYTEGSEDEVCPVGSTITMSNPNTGEGMVMEIVGTEVVDGIEMCHMVAEITVPADDEVAKMEMYTPINEDDESFIMTYYDKDGKILSEMKFMDGKMTMTDENGETYEMTMGMGE
nr:membrane-binding protein [uncultured Methanolobus sp.]